MAWKDFPFTSECASTIISKHVVGVSPTGLLNHENGKEFKKLLMKGENGKPDIVYEHWTPLSFFRDVFIIAKDLDWDLEINDFYELLIDNYRVVRITRDEDNILDTNGFKSKRSKETYEKLNIKIKETDLWNKYERILNE